MSLTRLWSEYRNELFSDPFLVLALSAALIALASTPIAFAILGRLDWFKARRGRILMRPTFASIVVGMILVMSIPAIFAALVLKSRSFDKNRYEFDPNKTWSVLEQGRGFNDLNDANQAVKLEMERLAFERKNLVNTVKKLDESMLALRGVAGTSVAVSQRFPSVLQALAGVRKSVGLDGPQQLLDYTAPPVDLRAIAANTPAASMPPLVASPAPVTASVAPTPAVASGSGLGAAEVGTELAAVPEPQRTIASMLPLSDLPPGWTVGKSGEHYIETFNADNLYEKIDGRAESFLQYGVKGMAYTFYHPAGDASNEIQLYIFEMPDALKALGKYGSEKPDEATAAPIGDQGYSSAGSTLFYAGKYYTQIVSTKDDPKFAAVALDLAKRVAARQKPGGTPAPTPVATTGTASSTPPSQTTTATKPAAQPAAEVTPAALFAFLPAQKRDGEPKYVAQDVFGYSFLSDVFMADYKDGDVTWQGFLRPYRDAKEAQAVFEQYIAGVKKDGAEVKKISTDGADEMVRSNNIGLVDFVFRKGNTLAGANGATNPAAGEAFARAMAKSLPANVPMIGSGK